MKSSVQLGSHPTADALPVAPHHDRRPDACIVFACDEAYGMPLATALRSYCEADSEVAGTPIYILENGISFRTRQKIEASIAEFKLSVQWISVDLTAFATCSTLHYGSQTTFARLKIAELLPTYLTRALYLDADILVLQSLTELLRTDLQGNAVGAVLDGMENRFSAAYGRPHGVPPVVSYFNAGVLLIDLERWKKSRIAERAIGFLKQNPATPYADQDALNVACNGEWSVLPEMYNFQRSREMLVGGYGRPAIIHFVTADKPWQPGTRDRNAAFYDRVRSRTHFDRSIRMRTRDGFLSVWRGVKRTVRSTSTGRALHAVLTARQLDVQADETIR